jgi:L-threonylcarbamoyladenylate synthase
MEQVERAAEILKAGGVIAYPTDTIYGLGANIFDEVAIMRVIALKRRPIGKPISVAVCSINMMENIAYLSEEDRKIAERLLPGPVTLVLTAKEAVSPLLSGNTGKIGIRRIDRPLVDRLIELAKFPITATSANISGGSPAAKKEDLAVAADFVLEGECMRKIPSTVVDLGQKRIIREGAGIEKVRSVLGI